MVWVDQVLRGMHLVERVSDVVVQIKFDGALLFIEFLFGLGFRDVLILNRVIERLLVMLIVLGVLSPRNSRLVQYVVIVLGFHADTLRLGVLLWFTGV